MVRSFNASEYGIVHLTDRVRSRIANAVSRLIG